MLNGMEIETLQKQNNKMVRDRKELSVVIYNLFVLRFSALFSSLALALFFFFFTSKLAEPNKQFRPNTQPQPNLQKLLERSPNPRATAPCERSSSKPNPKPEWFDLRSRKPGNRDKLEGR